MQITPNEIIDELERIKMFIHGGVEQQKIFNYIDLVIVDIKDTYEIDKHKKEDQK